MAYIELRPTPHPVEARGHFQVADLFPGLKPLPVSGVARGTYGRSPDAQHTRPMFGSLTAGKAWELSRFIRSNPDRFYLDNLAGVLAAVLTAALPTEPIGRFSQRRAPRETFHEARRCVELIVAMYHIRPNCFHAGIHVA